MAYTKVAPVQPTLTGAAYAFTAPSGVGAGNGDELPVGSALLVNNASGSSITLTFNVPITYEGLAITSPTATVPAGQTLAFGPFKNDPFGVQSGADEGYVRVDYSSIATVTRLVLLVV